MTTLPDETHDGQAKNQVTQLPHKPLSKTPDGLAAALTQLGVGWRWNLRASRPEFSRDGAPWQPVSDLFIDSLRMEIAVKFSCATSDTATAPMYFGAERWQSCLNALMYEVQVDPFRQWLESLESWDGVPRLNHWMTWAFSLPDPCDKLTQWASRTLFLGCVARTFQPGCKLDEMVVLAGPQGCGKSTALRWMFPIDHPEWFGDGLHLSADNKERTESLMGKVMVEASELAGSNRAELESLKGFLSRTDDGGIRLAYRRNPEASMPRRCIVAGTMNHDGLPNDPTGNRRFVVVKVQPGDYSGKGGAAGVRDYMEMHRPVLWAEALAMYWQDVPAWLPAELAPVQALTNEDHRRRDDVIEDALAEWLENGNHDFTTGEAAVGIGLVRSGDDAKVSRRDEMRLAAALTQAGCTKHRRRLDMGLKWVWSVPTCSNLL